MDFANADLMSLLATWVASSELYERAEAHNIRFEERLHSDRLSTFERGLSTPCTDYMTLRDHLSDYVRTYVEVGLRRLVFRSQSHADQEWKTAALDEVRSILAKNPNLTYARILYGQFQGEHGNAMHVGSFASAFLDAMKQKDPRQFIALEKLPGYEARIVDAAKAFLFRDVEAGNRTLVWLRSEVKSEGRTRSALRHFLDLRFDTSAVADGAGLATLVAANDNFRLDLIESVLATEEMLLAA